MNQNGPGQNTKRNAKRKKGNRIWLFMLITISVAAIAAGSVYFAAEHRLSLNENTPEKQVENALIKEAVKHPAEIAEMVKSVTVTAQDDHHETTAASEPEIKTATTVQTQITDNAGSLPPSILEIAMHRDNYNLIETSAVNLGGNTYILKAVVQDKTTGKTMALELTRELDEATKDLLRQYRK
ncbi:MAG: hypothetical protein AB9844_02490 [Clostridiaceae bacterium]